MEEITHKELVKIKKEVEDLKKTQDLSIRLDKDRYLKYVDRIIGKSTQRARVFLAIDGKRTLKDVGEKTGMKQPNVWTSKNTLERAGLIFALGGGKCGSIIYAKPHWVYVLHVDDHIREKLGIEDP